MMRRNVVLPFKFLRTGSKAIRQGKWFQKRSEPDISWLENGGAIDDWSYDSPLSLGRVISVDGPTLLEELDLAGTSASIELIHSLHVSNMGQRELLFREELDLGGVHKSQMLKAVDSSRLCERIRLVTSIILKDTLGAAPRCAASSAGSILWQDETMLQLEGEGSRFPMRDLPFSSLYKLPNNASWHLEWRPALLHYSFNSAVTLLLNSERNEFFEKIQSGDQLVIEQVMSSITGEICARLLRDDDFIEEETDYPEGSLGAVARSWLMYGFPGMSLAEIRREYDHSPAIVHTALRGMSAEM